MESKKLCMSVAEMANSLGIGLSVAYRIVRDKDFYPAKKIGDRIIISIADLEHWLSQYDAKPGEV